jgi:chromosome partitioning protein
MIITVASFKGGVGKTTSSVHIATYLNTKAPTLLIDGDLNRSALRWASRGHLPFRVVDERQAVRFARDFQHVVVDTAARPDEEDLRALADGCDLLVIPATPDVLALEALILTVKALNKLETERLRVLLTCVPPPPSKSLQEARAALAELDLPVFSCPVRRFAAFTKAALMGIPVCEVKDPRAALAWSAYEQVGREILGESTGDLVDLAADDETLLGDPEVVPAAESRPELIEIRVAAAESAVVEPQGSAAPAASAPDEYAGREAGRAGHQPIEVETPGSEGADLVADADSDADAEEGFEEPGDDADLEEGQVNGREHPNRASDLAVDPDKRRRRPGKSTPTNVQIM